MLFLLRRRRMTCMVMQQHRRSCVVGATTDRDVWSFAKFEKVLVAHRIANELRGR